MTKVGKKNVISAAWPLGHITPLWLLNLDRGLLTIPLQDRVSQLWWHILFCPQTEWAWGATAGHATANYPSETWRESLSCITHVHTESTDTFNESKKVLLAFTLLLNFIWILKKMQNLTSQAGSIQEWRARAFSRSLKLFRFGHSNAQTHFIISFVCLLWWCLSDLVSVRELERSMKSLVMAPAHFLHVFPPFVELSIRLRKWPW